MRGKPAYLGVAISGLSVQETAFLEVLDNFRGIPHSGPSWEAWGWGSHSLVMPSAKMSDILQQDDKMRMLGWSMMSTCPDGWNGQKRGWERLKLSLRRG